MKKRIIIIVIFLIIIQLTGCNEEKIQETDEIEKEINCVIQKPGSDDYNSIYTFVKPLEISKENPGPGGTTSLESCIEYCSQNLSCECRDWIQSIYNSFDTSNQVETEKINGIWLPTICTVRDAVKKIPILKETGINTVSFGPDIGTRHLDEPTVIGANLFRFYVKLFEDAGFNVHLVPNPMHWGNHDVSLYELNDIILDWAEEAEELNTKFYTACNEVDATQESIEETSDWLQEVLPLIKEKYSGIVCAQPSAPGLQSGLINYSGFDCVSSFYSLMVPDEERNNRTINQLKTITSQIRIDYPSVKYILFNDVATFSGGNWAETQLIEQQLDAEKRGAREYSTEEEQARFFEQYLEEVHPFINGSFFNNYKGFTFIGRAAQQIVQGKYTQYGTISITEEDYIWNTAGLIDIIENATLGEQEKSLIFDLEKYSGEAAGWAGLCFEPTPESPGPFNCSNVEECMQCFKDTPEEYWIWRVEHC